jgi:hypothetical protein
VYLGNIYEEAPLANFSLSLKACKMTDITTALTGNGFMIEGGLVRMRKVASSLN